MLATPAEGEIELARLLLRQRDELLQRLGRASPAARAPRPAARRHDAHAGEILHRIERHGLVDRARDGVAVGGQHQRVAVVRGLGHGGGPGRPGGSRR